MPIGQTPEPSACLSRLAPVALAHPLLALPMYQALEARWLPEDPQAATEAVLGQFFVLERLGRAGELWQRLHNGLDQARLSHQPGLAARLHEALGRIHYQRSEYAESTAQWSNAVDLAQLAGDERTGVAARIGMGQIHYALGNWQDGERFHADAEALLAGFSDPYLESKLALNLGVGLFHQQAYSAAQAQFERGLAAARRARHRDYQAEALWHLARCAQARGELQKALQSCRDALGLAMRIGYAWLQAMASNTLSELAFAAQDTAEAIRAGEQALAVARRMGARRLQSAAHRALARLYQAEGRLAAALEQLWQHQALEQELQRLSLPERIEQLAQYDLSRKPPEEQLLELSNHHWTVDTPEDLCEVAQQIRAEVCTIMGIDRLRLWWDERSDGHFRLLCGEDDSAQLSAPRHAAYLSMIDQTGGPLSLGELSLHPCHAELAEFNAGTQSRIEVGLHAQGRLVALLWLEQCQALRAWTRQDLLRASHIAKVYERLLLALDLALAKQARTEVELEKNNALGRLVAGIAHDVNTPIGVAITAASGMDDAAKRLTRALAGERVSRTELQGLAQQLSSSAELIDRNLQRAASLIGDFKRVAVDQSSGAVMDIQLGDYLRSIVAVHGPALRKAQARASVDVEAELELRLAPGLLSQIVSNLLMNSLTHAFVHGRGGEITIRAHREGDQVCLDFADDGVGASDEVRAHIFEPFFTTRRGQGGSGLGMYIVHDLVGRLGGTIALPPCDKGFRVRLQLPLKQAAAA